MKCAFGSNGVLDLSFLFIEDIWHDVQKGSGSILNSIYFQKIAVYLAINDMVDLCPNLWCNNSKETFFLGATLLDLAFYFLFTKKSSFLCALCVRVTVFFLLYRYWRNNPPLYPIERGVGVRYRHGASGTVIMSPKNSVSGRNDGSDGQRCNTVSSQASYQSACT